MILDTSILVEMLTLPLAHADQQRIRNHLRGHSLYISPIHLGELADACRRRGLAVQPFIDHALTIATAIPLGAAIAVQASAIKAEARRRKSGRDFSLIDGIGLATARSRGMPMVTMDHEFDGFPDVTVIDR